MRKTTLALTKTKVRGIPHFVVTVPKPTGGRSRRFFTERRAAETFLQLAKVQQTNFGTASFALTEAHRAEYLDCVERLRPYSITLREAVDFILPQLKARNRSATASELTREFLASKVTDGASARYLGDLKSRLGRFAGDFDGRMVATITGAQIDDWLRALNVSPTTRNNFRRVLIVAFNFALQRGYVVSNPAETTAKAKEHVLEIEILTLQQTARLLESASAETLPYWAIGVFGGLRVAEIERLVWEEVDFERGLIEIKASKAKTASRRHVHIQPNLAEWLAPYSGMRGPICPMGLRKKLEADRERAALRQNWPQNALRHSFGSYYLARFPDAAALALQMGNSPEMIFKHYRELVRPADAAKYWTIRPAVVANVVALSA